MAAKEREDILGLSSALLNPLFESLCQSNCNSRDLRLQVFLWVNLEATFPACNVKHSWRYGCRPNWNDFRCIKPSFEEAGFNACPHTLRVVVPQDYNHESCLTLVDWPKVFFYVLCNYSMLFVVI